MNRKERQSTYEHHYQPHRGTGRGRDCDHDRPKGKPKRLELGEHIVADPLICHGKPAFKGTRIMVWQVLDDVADGHYWDFICNVRWGGRIPIGAVAEAVKLARRALLDHRGRLLPAA
jgi:hypothetical protein